MLRAYPTIPLAVTSNAPPPFHGAEVLLAVDNQQRLFREGTVYSSGSGKRTCASTC
ncbi:MAG: hypothetical protein HY698_05480 [Deltaproteobacteria bacterium]|nr:hypothetical protein [Deltaproteobacteria bacterium]